jgi:hypothetical protein
VGQTKTLELDLASTQDTAVWTLEATELTYVTDVNGGTSMQSPTLKLVLDKTTGKNGDKINLAVTTLAAGHEQGTSTFNVNSTLNGVTETLPVLVQTN